MQIIPTVVKCKTENELHLETKVICFAQQKKNATAKTTWQQKIIPNNDQMIPYHHFKIILNVAC